MINYLLPKQEASRLSASWLYAALATTGLLLTSVAAGETAIEIIGQDATLTTVQADLELFDELADDKNIPFEDSSGCFERAEEMRRLLEKKGLHVTKIWAFERPHAPLIFQEPFTDTPTVPWSFHVAIAMPIVTVNGQKKINVFDPKIFDGPVDVSVWAKKMGTDPTRVYITEPDIYPKPYYNYPDTTKRPYTREENTSFIQKEFAPYLSKRTMRGVFPSPLRQEFCARKQDTNICIKSGITWTTVPNPNMLQNRNEITVFAGVRSRPLASPTKPRYKGSVQRSSNL